MTVKQLAAYLNSLFDDDAIFKGSMHEYDCERPTDIEGEIDFNRLAIRLVKDGHVKLDSKGA